MLKEEFRQQPSLLCLFLSFFRLGLTAFGGPAIISYIRKIVVEEKKWLDGGSFHHGIALCQTIPGATAMQISTYVGLRKGGVLGAAVSFLAFVLPAFSLMMLLSALYVKTHSLPTVISIFNGLQVIIVAIVANATLSIGRISLNNRQGLLIALIAFSLFTLNFSPILVIFLASLLGIWFYQQQTYSPVNKELASKSYSFKQLGLLFFLVLAFYLLLFFVNRSLFNLAILMSKIDLFAFGGGFASIPLMLHEIVGVRSWMDNSTFLNGIALGQVTPGPIVITATFIGYLLYGSLGGLIATIGVFLPSFLLVVGVVPYFDRLLASPNFNRAIAGIVCSFVGLLLSVTLQFASNISWDFLRLFLAGGAFGALVRKVDLLWVLLMGIIISALFL